LRRDGHDVILTIAGAVQVWHLTAAEASRYGERLVADLEAGGGTYLGRLDPSAVPAMLREHQIACVPSLADEPFSLSALEAMASGCAVVASRRGGLPEVVGDAGTLFDPDDTDGLVAALVPLVTDPDLLADRRRSARVRSETFPWTATATGVLTPDPPE
jgi:glycosyltransferase involved in cell wall biosynthesis